MTAIAAVRGRGRVDHILRTAARGAALIGVAVVIGIVLLQVVDKGGPVGGGSSGAGTTVTTTKDGKTTSTTAAAGRPPQEVRVTVLNGSGVSGVASAKANELRGLGYAIAGTNNSALQTGTLVECRVGFSKEADTLAKAVSPTTQVAPFPDPAPPDSENADCVVIIGK